MAMRLETLGYPDPLDMTPGQILYRIALAAKEEGRAFDMDAMSARLAGAGQKDWKAHFGK